MYPRRPTVIFSSCVRCCNQLRRSSESPWKRKRTASPTCWRKHAWQQLEVSVPVTPGAGGNMPGSGT
eukprot:1633894-Prymnesium_polylepis.1